MALEGGPETFLFTINKFSAAAAVSPFLLEAFETRKRTKNRYV